MAADGFSGDEISQALSLTRSAFHYARTGDGWETYLAEESKAVTKEWFPYMGLSDKEDDPRWEFMRLNNDCDPSPVLAKVQCPVLALFGGRDLNVTAAQNLPKWKAALRHSNANLDIFTMNADGSNLKRIATGITVGGCPDDNCVTPAWGRAPHYDFAALRFPVSKAIPLLRNDGCILLSPPRDL